MKGLLATLPFAQAQDDEMALLRHHLLALLHNSATPHLIKQFQSDWHDALSQLHLE